MSSAGLTFAARRAAPVCSCLAAAAPTAGAKRCSIGGAAARRARDVAAKRESAMASGGGWRGQGRERYGCEPRSRVGFVRGLPSTRERGGIKAPKPERCESKAKARRSKHSSKAAKAASAKRACKPESDANANFAGPQGIHALLRAPQCRARAGFAASPASVG